MHPNNNNSSHLRSAGGRADISFAAQAERVNRSGAAKMHGKPWGRGSIDAGESVHRFTSFANGDARGLSAADPAGCVRPPPDQWFSTEENCIAGAPPNTTCHPRYINGVWTYYAPFAADPDACSGDPPADILPQVLDSNSIVQNDSWYTLDNVVLQLMMNGYIGELSFSTAVDNVIHTYDIVFTQNDFIQEDLFAPLIYRYSVLMTDLPPDLNQRAILEINLTNGYATVTLPMGNGTSMIQFVMTNILPVLNAA